MLALVPFFSLLPGLILAMMLIPVLAPIPVLVLTLSLVLAVVPVLTLILPLTCCSQLHSSSQWQPCSSS